MTEYSIVQIGEEFAVAADKRLVIKFGSAELAGELVKALTGQDSSRPPPAAHVMYANSSLKDENGQARQMFPGGNRE